MPTYIMDLGKYGDHITGCVELDAEDDAEAVTILKEFLKDRGDEPIVYQLSMMDEAVREVRLYLNGIDPDTITEDTIGDVWDDGMEDALND